MAAQGYIHAWEHYKDELVLLDKSWSFSISVGRSLPLIRKQIRFAGCLCPKTNSFVLLANKR